MSRKYYTLAQRDEYGLWWPQFGDYDREVVYQERNDWIEAGEDNPACLKVVATDSDDQVAIDRACAELGGFIGDVK